MTKMTQQKYICVDKIAANTYIRKEFLWEFGLLLNGYVLNIP